MKNVIIDGVEYASVENNIICQEDKLSLAKKWIGKYIIVRTYW